MSAPENFTREHLSIHSLRASTPGPWITCVAAMSLDGYIARFPGESDAARRATGFGAEADRNLVESWMHEADAIVVGAGSIRAAGGVWDIGSGKQPHWYILTRSGFASDDPLWQQSHITKSFVSPRTLQNSQGLEVLVYGDQSPAKFLHHQFAIRHHRIVLLFGGPDVNADFFAAGLVHQLNISICPLIVGSSAGVPLLGKDLPSNTQLTLHTSNCQGNLVFLTYSILHKS
jgi:riboflavin biosynthesis pyrimidine reductase